MLQVGEHGKRRVGAVGLKRIGAGTEHVEDAVPQRRQETTPALQPKRHLRHQREVHVLARDGCAGRDAKAYSGDAERIVAAPIGQHAAARAAADEQAGLHDLDPDLAGSLRKGWRGWNGDSQQRGRCQ